MSVSVRDYIRKVLRDLRDDEFRTFKANLRDYQVEQGYENIPGGDLEHADALKVSQLLIRYYCENYAVQVAYEVLIASNCMPQAQMLLPHLERTQK